MVAQPNEVTIDGFCQCKSNYIWNFASQRCEDCSTLSNISKCAYSQCINYYVQGNSCKKCPSNTISRNLLTLPNECICKKGFIWSQSAGICIACDSATSILSIKSNSCLACKDLTNAEITPINSYSCKCKFNYVFIEGSCTCNTTKQLFDLGNSKGCGSCSQVIGGTTFNSTSKGCNCISGAVWSSQLAKCRCSLSYNYLVKSVSESSCFPCTNLGTGVSFVANLTYPDQCICEDAYIWNSTFSNCVCKSDSQIYFKNSSQCKPCGTEFYSSSSRAGPSSCQCFAGMVWNSSSGLCVCDSLSVIIDKSFPYCQSCSTIPGGTGLRINTTHCGCKSGWLWNPTLKTCACLTKSCICPKGQYLNANNICSSCSLIIGSTNNSNSNACQCKDSFVWNALSFKCDCPQGAIFSASKAICRFCNIISNSKGSASTSSCSCMANYNWNVLTMKCEFVNNQPATKNIILLINGTKASCSGLGGSIGIAADNFNCRC